MPHYHDEKILPYRIKDLFDLVMDIESYPKFLPWCKAARILHRDEDYLTAELVIHFKGMTQTYVSKVYHREPSYIKVEHIKGPFKELINIWEFKREDNLFTKIIFDIKFEFKFSLLNSIMSLIYAEAAKKLCNAFEERANKILHKIQ